MQTHSHSLMNLLDANEQLVEQLMKKVRRLLHYRELCQSYTPRCGQSFLRCEGDMWAYLCASVCIFQLVTNAGEIQMSQNYQCLVKCPRGRIYSL